MSVVGVKGSMIAGAEQTRCACKTAVGFYTASSSARCNVEFSNSSHANTNATGYAGACNGCRQCGSETLADAAGAGDSADWLLAASHLAQSTLYGNGGNIDGGSGSTDTGRKCLCQFGYTDLGDARCNSHGEWQTTTTNTSTSTNTSSTTHTTTTTTLLHFVCEPSGSGYDAKSLEIAHATKIGDDLMQCRMDAMLITSALRAGGFGNSSDFRCFEGLSGQNNFIMPAGYIWQLHWKDF